VNSETQPFLRSEKFESPAPLFLQFILPRNKTLTVIVSWQPSRLVLNS